MSDQEHLTVVEAEIVADGELDQGEEGISAPDASIVPAHPPGVGVDGDQVNVKTAASEAPQPLKSSESMPMSFPQKLMHLLQSEDGVSDSIGWLPHGKGFMIHKKKKFGDEVLPKYFKQCKFTSLTRKLNRWGFTRVTRGSESGAYYHKFFIRDDPRLVTQMSCAVAHGKGGFPNFVGGYHPAKGSGAMMMAADPAFVRQQLQQLQMHQLQLQHLQMQQHQQLQAAEFFRQAMNKQQEGEGGDNNKPRSNEHASQEQQLPLQQSLENSMMNNPAFLQTLQQQQHIMPMPSLQGAGMMAAPHIGAAQHMMQPFMPMSPQPVMAPQPSHNNEPEGAGGNLDSGTTHSV